MKFIDRLRLEWAMLRNYRRPHVDVRISHCLIQGTLDVAEVAAKLCDPRITRVSPDGDVSITIVECNFMGDGTNTAIRA